MALVNITDEEVALIQTLRAARLAGDKNASQQIQVGTQMLKFHVLRPEPRLWIVRIAVKKDDPV